MWIFDVGRLRVSLSPSLQGREKEVYGGKTADGVRDKGLQTGQVGRNGTIFTPGV